MTYKSNAARAEARWGKLSQVALDVLEDLTKRYSLRIAFGELLYLDGKWYVTHSELLRIATRRRCSGIQVRPALGLSDPSTRWAFKATVYKSKACRGFVGYGDADPSNVSFLVHGAEMRVAGAFVRLTAPCARPMESASARLRRSGPSPSRRSHPQSRKNSAPTC